MKNSPLYSVTKIERLGDILDIACREVPEKIAYRYKWLGKEESRSFRAFYDEVRALGSALAELGMNEKHIGCIGDNSYPWVTTYLTALLSRGVFVPVDKDMPKDDMIHVLNEGDVSILFCSEKIEAFIRTRRDEVPNIQYFVTFEREEDDGEFLSFSLLLKRGRELISKGYTAYTGGILEGNPEELKMLVFTSGTTGMSKGVMLSEKNLVSAVYYGLQVSTVYEVALSVLPYHHTYEAVVGLLVYLHHHSVTCINDSLAAVLKNLKHYQPTHIYLVPAFVELFHRKILSTMEQEGKTKAFEFGVKLTRALRKVGIDIRKTVFKDIHMAFGGRLRKIVCGGAPLRAEVAAFFDDIGITVCNGYGITECSPLVAVNPDNKLNDYRTVGFKLPCVDVKIDHPSEDGEGEICVKGDIVMLGYYKNPEETAKVLVDGWFHTGDLGHISPIGQISITGRSKNLIVLDNGKNVYPEEIENLILSVPYIQEVVVQGVKDESGKTVLLAECFLNKDAVKEMGKIPETEKILSDIRRQTVDLPSYKQITKILLRKEEFEKNSSRKIKRKYN